MHGYGTLSNLAKTEITKLLALDVIGLCETWIWYENFLVPRFFQEYDYFYSLAKKEFSRGRSSGGLIFFIRKGLVSEVKTLISSEWGLFLYLIIGNEHYVIGIVYWRPGNDYDYLADIIFYELNDLLSQFHDINFFIGGDFNSRVGLLNSLDDEIFDGTSLKGTRTSLDNHVNKRGKCLTELMEQLGFFLLNGRSVKDSPAKFTYISDQGSSLIDLVWCSIGAINIVNDFNISNVSHLSDHKMTLLKLSSLNSNLQVHLDNKNITSFQSRYLERNLTLYLEFMRSMECNQNIYFNSEDVFQLYETFYNTIYNTLRESGILRNKIFFTSKIIKNKPWFDSNCYGCKKELNYLYKMCKRNNFNQVDVEIYLTAKRKYKNTIKLSKQIYYDDIKNKLSNLKNPSEFWSVNSVRLVTISVPFQSPNGRSFMIIFCLLGL